MPIRESAKIIGNPHQHWLCGFFSLCVAPLELPILPIKSHVHGDSWSGSANTVAKKGLNVADQAFTIPQFIGTFKVGRTKVYEEIDSGRLPTYKLGRRRYISAHAAAEWQRRLEADTAGEKSFWEAA